MNETPQRICEALGWLYGVEFDFDDDVSYLKGTAFIFDPKEGLVNGQRLVIFARNNCDAVASWPYRRRENITAEVEHALAVTAPWEWTGPQKKVCNIPNVTGRAGVAVGDPHEGDFEWYLDLDDGKLSMDGECKSLAMAKKTARAAYLCWMRGRFAMKGCMA